MSTDALPHYPIRSSELPASWSTAFITDIAGLVEPGFPSGDHNRTGEGVPHLRPMNISRDGNITLEDVKYVPISASVVRLAEGDVLFNNTNSPVLIGKTAYIPLNTDFAFSNHMTRIRLKNGISPEFIARQLHYFWMTGYFKQRCVNHVNQASISSKPLANTVPVVIPPLAEQRRIVAKIEELFAELDVAVVELERVRVNLKRYRASVLKAAVTGELTADWRAKQRSLEPAATLLERILTNRRTKWEADQLAKFQATGKSPPKDWQAKYPEPSKADTTTLPTLPDGWCWATVEYLLNELICNGISVKGQDTPPGTPALRLSAMSENGFDYSKRRYIPIPDKVAEELQIRENDFYISRGNGSIHLVGRGSLAQTPPELIVFPDTMIRVRLMSVEMSRFVATLWGSTFIRKQVEKRARTTAGIYKISQKDVEEFVVPLPSLAEQEAIVLEVEARLSDVTAAEAVVSANLIRAARLRQSILKEAFAGRLVPQDPADEPAPALLERIRTAKPTAPPAKSSRGKRATATVNEALLDVMAYAVPFSTPSAPLNRTKLQKECYLIQTHLGCELVDSFLRAKFGPYSPDLEHAEPAGVERGYFTVDEVRAGEDKFAVRYTSGVNAVTGRAAGLLRLGEKADEAEKLVRLICAMSTNDAELFGTVYAVWNDILRVRKQADVITVIMGVHEWHPGKAKKFPPEVIRDRINWMRETGYIPTGRGKHTEPTKPKRGRKSIAE